jgi:outer membrane protein assembly factor BamB
MRAIALILSIVVLSRAANADDWRQFRGNDSSGVSTETNLPAKLDDPEALQWKTELPGRGLSGPVVVGDRIFLTASSGYRDDQLHVLCFSATTGERLWDRRFKATGRTVCHESMCMATPQACSDGERIYAYYSCNDVVCLDFDGNLIWYRGLGYDFPNASSSLGMSSSPVVADGALVLQLDTESESFATGLDALTGKTLWKLDREKSAIYASPALFHSPGSGAPEAVLQSTKSLQAVEPRTGKTIWEVKQPCGTVASSTVAGDLLVSPLRELTVLRPTESSGTPEIVWSNAKLTPDTPTPVVYQDRVYVLKESILSCADLATGKPDWQMRLKCKQSYASPLAANGHLYLADENGILQTIQLGGDKGKVASRLELGETIMCTPALAGGAFYVRSDKHLWKFAVPN